MLIETEHIVPNVKKFSQDQLKYFDYERCNETLTRITFPLNGKELDDKYYLFFARFLKYQYKLPVKYLEPEIESCYYISQKSPIMGNSKNISNASITIEPNNQNIFKQVSYVPINQKYEIGTIVSLHETIPFSNDDGTTPNRRLLTSASLSCSPLKDSNLKYRGLCNRCIPFSAIDVGSEVVGKFTVKTSPLRESMALYRFHRPEDNILEIITSDYLNVDAKYVFNLTKQEMLKNKEDKVVIDVIDEIMKKL